MIFTNSLRFQFFFRGIIPRSQFQTSLEKKKGAEQDDLMQISLKKEKTGQKPLINGFTQFS